MPERRENLREFGRLTSRWTVRVFKRVRSTVHNVSFVTLFPWWLNRIRVTRELPGLLKQMICWEWPHSNILTLPSCAPVRSGRNTVCHQLVSQCASLRSQREVFQSLCSRRFRRDEGKQVLSQTLNTCFFLYELGNIAPRKPSQLHSPHCGLTGKYKVGLLHLDG